MSCPADKRYLRANKEKRLHGGGVGPEMRSPAGLSAHMLNGSHVSVNGAVNEKSTRPVKAQHP